MIRSTGFAQLLAVTLLALAAAGCASQKEPAEQAVANLENSLAQASSQSEKYLPDETAALRGKVADLKSALDATDYKRVVAEAPAVSAEIRKLMADSAIARATFNERVQTAWTDYATNLPTAIASVDDRILRFTSGGGLPRGMNRDTFKATVASFDAAKATWGEAAEAGNAGKYEDAVAKAIEVKRTVESVQQAFGMATG